MATTKATVSVIADDAVGTAQIADNAITNALMADDAVGVAELSATGTASATTFLRGDNAWAAPVGITHATQQATTSGTAIDFTSIPAGTKRITIMFSGVSTNGTSDILVQLGDSGGVETSGYLSSAASGTSNVDSTAGFIITQGNTAAAVWGGSVTLNLQNAASFSWVGGCLLSAAGAVVRLSSGEKALSAELDRVRITMVNGTDAFDAGAINISYE